MSDITESSTKSSSSTWFSTTQWTVVLNARDERTGNEALSQLCQTYWFPLYAYARRRGKSPEDAADLTQGFFERLLEKRFLDSVDPEKGRFRSFLLVAMRRHMGDVYDRNTAVKRGGKETILSLDMEDAEGRYGLEPAVDETPETLFERHWALLLLDKVLRQLQTEFIEAGKGAQFNKLKSFLTGEAERHAYRAIAQELETTDTSLRMMVSRMRQRYRELFRQEVANTVHDEKEIEAELQHLFAALSR